MWSIVDTGNYYSYLFSFNLLSFVITSREEHVSCLPTECICNLILILCGRNISVSKKTNENSRTHTQFDSVKHFNTLLLLEHRKLHKRSKSTQVH